MFIPPVPAPYMFCSKASANAKRESWVTMEKLAFSLAAAYSIVWAPALVARHSAVARIKARAPSTHPSKEAGRSTASPSRQQALPVAPKRRPSFNSSLTLPEGVRVRRHF